VAPNPHLEFTMLRHLLLTAAAFGLATAAMAQFKVVDQDGRVTYTDKPGTSLTDHRANAKAGTAANPNSSLPLELRQAVSRYPVTLYAGKDCRACDSGRQLLQQRGIPFSEKRVESYDDIAAFQRLTGALTLPVLTIGAQQLRGLLAADWNSYLDAAGYPASSKLPANWQASAPTPLAAASTKLPAPAPVEEPVITNDTPVVVPADPNNPRIRF
jgi:glutaredoxin